DKLKVGTSPSAAEVPVVGSLVGVDTSQNNSLAAAVTLTTTPGFQTDQHYEVTSSLATAGDKDFFRVRAPAVAAGEQSALTVSARSLGLTPAAPVTVYDPNGNVVPSPVPWSAPRGTTPPVSRRSAGAAY